MPRKKKKPQPRYGLSRQHTRQHTREFVDFDYTHLLTQEEKDFLDKFSREYYQVAFNNTKKDLHHADEDRRALYTADNARRRDMWSQFDRLPLDLTDSINFEDDDK